MPTTPDPLDPSHGWDAIAGEFIESSQRSRVGIFILEAWARSFPGGAAILDLGCGPGVPRSAVLIGQGLSLYGVEASPRLAGAFRARFPTAQVTCEAVETSAYFGRTFDGALAWGLLFLLPAEVQRRVIHRVAKALDPGGRFLFTAPAQVCTWADLSTGQPSWSLGAEEYRAMLADAGLVLRGEYEDEGENHYYDAIRS